MPPPAATPFDLNALAAAAAECPDPPSTRPIGADIEVLPTSLTPIQLEIRPGWSPSTKAFCWWMGGRHRTETAESVQVAISGPAPDCIVVPEVSLPFGLAAGALALVAAARRRRASPS